MAALLFFAGLASCERAGASEPFSGDYEPGISLSFCNGKDIPTEEQLAAIKAAGFEWVEVVMNPFSSRYCAADSIGYKRALEEKRRLDKAGLKVWSCHLPYSKLIDISLLNSELREKAVREDEKMIKWAAMFSPERIVLHPSSEPIDEGERAERLKQSASSIARLNTAVRKIGAILCVENLPRTCLGRNSEEILYLVLECPDVKVCFDSNHLLEETHSHFFETVQTRIGTIHASDYDRKDERHWIEGTGVIDWTVFLQKLKKSCYEGIFMHEVRSGDNLTPASIMEAYRKVVLP